MQRPEIQRNCGYFGFGCSAGLAATWRQNRILVITSFQERFSLVSIYTGRVTSSSEGEALLWTCWWEMLVRIPTDDVCHSLERSVKTVHVFGQAASFGLNNEEEAILLESLNSDKNHVIRIHICLAMGKMHNTTFDTKHSRNTDHIEESSTPQSSRAIPITYVITNNCMPWTQRAFEQAENPSQTFQLPSIVI